MVDFIKTRKQSFFAEDDLGYDWLIHAWTILYHNVVEIEGIVYESEDIEGTIYESCDVEGIVLEDEDIEGVAGRGTK